MEIYKEKTHTKLNCNFFCVIREKANIDDGSEVEEVERKKGEDDGEKSAKQQNKMMSNQPFLLSRCIVFCEWVI